MQTNKLLCLCWEQGHIPQDMRDAKHRHPLHEQGRTAAIVTTTAASPCWHFIMNQCGKTASLHLTENLSDRCPSENRLSTEAPCSHHLLPPGHAEHSLLRWGYLRTLPSQQWSEAGLCTGTNSIRDLLLDAPPIRVCRLRRWSVRPDEA